MVTRMHREAASVLDLLGSGADAGKADSRGDTPLHHAVDRLSKFSADVVGALVDGGADPNAKNPEGETPLHTAIRNGGNAENPKVVEALLAAGADPCIRDAAGYIPYSTAREGGAVHGMLANAGGHDRACDGAPEIVGADRRMQASERANLRSGPGTDYDKVGLLEAGNEVTVTGEVGEWLRIEVLDGGEAFVHGSLLAEASGSTGTAPAVDLQPLCAGSAEGSACWLEFADRPGCHFWVDYYSPVRGYVWSGQCADGIANGEGTLSVTKDGVLWFEGSGVFNFGKRHGHWVLRDADGRCEIREYSQGDHVSMSEC